MSEIARQVNYELEKMDIVIPDYHFDCEVLEELKERKDIGWIDSWRRAQLDCEMKEFDEWRDCTMKAQFMEQLTVVEHGRFVACGDGETELNVVATLSVEKQEIYKMWQNKPVYEPLAVVEEIRKETDEDLIPKNDFPVFYRMRNFLSSLTDEQSTVFLENLQNPKFYYLMEEHLFASQYGKMIELEEQIKLMRGQDKLGNYHDQVVDELVSDGTESVDQADGDKFLLLPTEDTAGAPTDGTRRLRLLNEAITRKVEEFRNRMQCDSCLVGMCPLVDKNDYTMIPYSKSSADAIVNEKSWFSTQLHQKLENMVSKLNKLNLEPEQAIDQTKVLLEISADGNNSVYSFDMGDLDDAVDHLAPHLTTDRTTNEVILLEDVQMFEQVADVNEEPVIIPGEQHYFKIDVPNEDENRIRAYLIGHEESTIALLRNHYDTAARITSRTACINVQLTAPTRENVLNATLEILKRLRCVQSYELKHSNGRNRYWRCCTKDQMVRFQTRFQVTIDWDRDNDCILIMKSFSETNLAQAVEELNRLTNMLPHIPVNNRVATFYFEQLFLIRSAHYIFSCYCFASPLITTLLSAINCANTLPLFSTFINI